MRTSIAMRGFAAALAVVCCSILTPVSDGHAAPITFQVIGTLTGFDGPVLAPLAIGDAYTATYTFDSAAVATPVFGGGNDYVGAIESASFSIGTYSGTLASPPDTTIRVLNDYFGNQDQYLAVLGDVTFGGPSGVIAAPPVTGPLGQLLAVRLALVQLDDFPGIGTPDGLSSSDLPLVPPDMALFTNVGWSLEFVASDQSASGRARGTIQSISLVTAQPVPEPSSVGLLMVGLLLIACLAWRPLCGGRRDAAGRNARPARA
ncbi:MAG: PEP-CTERM sorting domain-containing protein [Dongiaceae bacterium]